MISNPIAKVGGGRERIVFDLVLFALHLAFLGDEIRAGGCLSVQFWGEEAFWPIGSGDLTAGFS